MTTTRVNLSGGSYTLKNLSVSCQRCLNLIPETVPGSQEEPTQYYYSNSPGLKPVYTDRNPKMVRCLYTTSQGDLIAVIGANVVRVNPGTDATYIGSIDDGLTQVRMQDNGLTLFIVDGTMGNGWYVSMPSDIGKVWSNIVKISDPNFYGSNTVGVLDQFLLFNQPNSRHWYVSPSDFTDEQTTPFDSLYIASKTSYPDPVVGLTTIGQTIWIFGRQTTELWYNSGSADFPFQRTPSILADQGCESPYTIATTYGQVFWLGRDRSGHANVYSGVANNSEKISNYALEEALQSYGDLSDSIGFTYQQNGHQFYVLTIPHVGKTWCYDTTTQLWHERCSTDSNGNEVRLRANCWASAYGKVYCGDYENGTIYEVSQDFFTENGNAIKRERSFFHMLTGGNRSIHRQFMLDLQSDTSLNVSVSWSDNRGQSFSSPVTINMQNFNTYGSIWRLGMTRDRVYNISYLDSGRTALMGAFLQIDTVKN